MTDPKIPFGKYKGKFASEVPVSYLDWLIGQEWFVRDFPGLCEKITEHLKGERPEWQYLGV